MERKRRDDGASQPGRGREGGERGREERYGGRDVFSYITSAAAARYILSRCLSCPTRRGVDSRQGGWSAVLKQRKVVVVVGAEPVIDCEPVALNYAAA